MVIKKLGHSSFRIRGAGASVVCDPFDGKMVGLKFPRTTADIVTVSHQHADHNATAAVGGDPFVVDGPGEYEVKGVRIHGIATYHDDKQGEERGGNVIYLLHVDDVAVMHCGDLGHKLLDEHLELLEEVDILFIPVGGVYTIDAKTAAQVVSQIEPKIVIPMHYNCQGLNQETFGQLSDVEVFLKEMGNGEVRHQEKLVVSKQQIPEETEVIVLK